MTPADQCPDEYGPDEHGPVAEGPRWLPGIMGIGTLFFAAGASVAYVSLTRWPHGAARNSAAVLGVMLVIGAAGLLALRRWGWAMSTAGAILSASMCGFAFARSHESNWFIWSAASTVFFLYLIRASVRSRMR